MLLNRTYHITSKANEAELSRSQKDYVLFTYIAMVKGVLFYGNTISSWISIRYKVPDILCLIKKIVCKVGVRRWDGQWAP